jgi:hypothetical protein
MRAVTIIIRLVGGYKKLEDGKLIRWGHVRPLLFIFLTSYYICLSLDFSIYYNLLNFMPKI